MTFWSKTKLLAALSAIGGAVLFWRRPARTTEITLRRQPVDTADDSTDSDTR